MYDVKPFVKPVPLDFKRAPDRPNDTQELMAFRHDRSASHSGERMREFLSGEELKAEIRALLNEWQDFAKDVQSGCAAGQDWLDALRARTVAAIESLPTN